MLDSTWEPNARPVFLARESRTIGDLFLRRIDADGGRLAFQTRAGSSWVQHTWRDFYNNAAAVASFLMNAGVAPGDKVCMVGGTRPEWCYGDIGGHLAGAVTLGAYPTLTAEQLAYVLDHSDTKVVFVQGAAEVAKLLAMRDKLSELERVCVWDTDDLGDELEANDWITSFSEVLAQKPDRGQIDARVAEIDPSSTAIIVYTSGTTGPPKGAMISHQNILTCLASYESVFGFDRDDQSFNFLPMAHVAERVAGFYGRINGGIATTFASSLPKVLEEVQDVKPTVFGSVPRIFEKAYDKIMAGVESAPPGKQRIFRWAERIGRDVVQRWQRGEPVPFITRLQYRLADRLVFSKLRGVFGGRVRHFVTGAAPIADEILEFFWAAGFPIFEVYGMTEATVITHCNRPGQVRLGSVGQAVPVIEERIADDGEILLRGPAVFQGYYKAPEATAEAIDKDGWLHTGDIGEQDSDGYLYIRDRKKHIIITAGGKNLTPANIENEIKASDPMISQVHAHGDKRPYLTAIVTLGAAEAVEHARSRGLLDDAKAKRLLAELAENPYERSDEMLQITKDVTDDDDLRKRIAESVRKANRRLAKVETIKKIYLLDRELSMAHDEVTPTLKIKRKAVEGKFAEIFDRLYEDSSFGLEVERKA